MVISEASRPVNLYGRSVSRRSRILALSLGVVAVLISGAEAQQTFCDKIRRIVTASRSFRELRGAFVERRDDGQEYASTYTLPNAAECRIRQSIDHVAVRVLCRNASIGFRTCLFFAAPHSKHLSAPVQPHG